MKTTRAMLSEIEAGGAPVRPVLIVGAGPVGLLAANLLGHAEVPVVVVERNAATSDEAKAISLDDETLRVMQRCGLAAHIQPVLHPGVGTRYFGADGHALFQAGSRYPYRYGHPFKSSFAQPELELTLLRTARNRSSVSVRFETEVVGATVGEDSVRCVLRLDGGREEEFEACYLLGCDGGKSTVRQQLGISMAGRSFTETWLVVDTVNDPHRERYGMHHGDPRRPHVVIPGRNGRCRYEFKLGDDEAEPGRVPPGLAEALVSQLRPITAEEIERCCAYRFHALMAEEWQKGRAFLLGDAAHMMPPFAGQGLNTGLRDVDNLAWKLAAVFHGQLAPAALDTYEAERRATAAGAIRLSTRLGEIVMTSSRSRARTRDALVRVAVRTPKVGSYLRETRFKPAARYETGFVVRSSHADVGRIIEQPRVLTAGGEVVLLDDLLGAGFAVLGVNVDGDAWHQLRQSRLHGLDPAEIDVVLDDMAPIDVDGYRGISDVDGHLERIAEPWRGRFVLLRPDRYIAAIFAPEEAPAVCQALATFQATPAAAPAAR